jgi:hypothetical protein
MQTWEEMVKTALLGTERQASPLQSGDALLQSVLTQLNAEDRERALLGAAGAATLVRRAGYMPAPLGGLETTTAETDDTPLCRNEAVNDLPMVLDGQYQNLLPEWLSLVAGQGQRVPERWLPALLDKGTRDKDLRPPVASVLGNRGRWLATQNPAWQYGLQRTLAEGEEEALPEAIWETGYKEERISYIAALRRRDPALARTKIKAVWAQEGYEERAAFLREFSTNLSMDDEPFLEAALDDKRKEVRSVAQEFLRRLPESRLCQRMIERARPLLSLSGNKLLGNKIEVNLPEAHDKTMARDGIDAKPPAYPKIGERAFWMQEIIAATPLTFWTTHLDRPAEQLVKMATANKDWRDGLINNWTRALECPVGRAEWSEALLHYWLAPKAPHYPHSIPWPDYLQKDRLEDLLIDAFTVEAINSYHGPVRTLLGQVGPIWGNKLAKAVFAGISSFKGKSDNNITQLIYFLQQTGEHFPEAMRSDLHTLWRSMLEKLDDTNYSKQYGLRSLDEQVARMTFYREMRKHITGE